MSYQCKYKKSIIDKPIEKEKSNINHSIIIKNTNLNNNNDRSSEESNPYINNNKDKNINYIGYGLNNKKEE